MAEENPDPAMVKKILADINMNEKELEEAVVQLRDWLLKQPHLPKSADDVMLKAFIIGCKSVERAKAKLDSYYTVRVHHKTPFFENRDPCAIKWHLGQIVMCLPGLTPDGCKILLCNLPPKECIADFDSGESFKLVLMFYEMFIRRYYMCSGVYVLLDMTNLSLELTLKASLSLTSQFSKIYQESYPIRLKAMIAFNPPPLAESFFNTFIKPFFSQKLKERMFITSGGHDTLAQWVPQEMLPSDYGGKNETSHKYFEADVKFMEGMRNWYLKEGNEKSMEDFRPKPDNNEMKGTFRKIQAE